MDKKILIIDQLPGDYSNDIYLNYLSRNAKDDIIIVAPEPEEIMNALEINGIKYHRRPKDDGHYKSKGSHLKFLAATALLAGGLPTIKGRKRPKVNIEEEFALIQNKQSNLCRSDRDWVVSRFNDIYEEVK